MIALVEGPKESVSDILEEPVSASRINCFHSCRQKFFFRYVQKIQKPASAALHVGKAVHHALQQWSRRRWMGEPSDKDSIKEEFTEGWKSLVDESPVEFPEGEETTQRDKGWGLVEMYLRETPIPTDEKPEAVEIAVESDLSKHGLTTLRGVIDLVRPEGVVVDYKTTATSPNEDQALHRNEIQLTVYGLLYEAASEVKAKAMELHHLVKTKVPKLVVTTHGPVTEVQRIKLFKSIESYLGGVQREDWVPSPGLQCSSCEYFQECRGAGL